MATHPEQGGSDGTWGTEIMAWLETQHDNEGYHTLFVCNENQVVCNEDVMVCNPSTY